MAGYQEWCASEFLARLPALLEEAEARGRSLAIRARGCGWQEHLLQFDDCLPEAVRRLAPFAFVRIGTSEAGEQCWLALDESIEASECPEIHRRIKATLAGLANGGAHGAVRWPGSINHKPGREGYCVRVREVNHGRRVTREELERAGLLAPPKPPGVVSKRLSGGPRPLPDYELCLAEVRSRTDGGDTSDSAADFRACLYAIGRGASEAEVEAWLPEVSETAAAKGRDYVRRTVAAAARTAAR